MATVVSYETSLKASLLVPVKYMRTQSLPRRHHEHENAFRSSSLNPGRTWQSLFERVFLHAACRSQCSWSLAVRDTDADATTS